MLYIYFQNVGIYIYLYDKNYREKKEIKKMKNGKNPVGIPVKCAIGFLCNCNCEPSMGHKEWIGKQSLTMLRVAVDIIVVKFYNN